MNKLLLAIEKKKVTQSVLQFSYRYSAIAESVFVLTVFIE